MKSIFRLTLLLPRDLLPIPCVLWESGFLSAVLITFLFVIGFQQFDCDAPSSFLPVSTAWFFISFLILWFYIFKMKLDTSSDICLNMSPLPLRSLGDSLTQMAAQSSPSTP